MSEPGIETKTLDEKAAFIGTRKSPARWLIIGGIALALVVGLISPTLGTFAYLGGALLVLGLLLPLRTLAAKPGQLSVRVRPEIVVVVTSLAVGLVLSEVALRLFLFQSFPDFQRMDRESLGFQHDRTLGWFPVPNSFKTANETRGTISIAHNTRGFRDPEPCFDNRPGIVFLGDSFTWGYHVEASERFTDKLRGRHPEWQIYNFGVVGYGTDQEYLLLQRHFQQYHPRLVFLVFCTENDYIDNCTNGGGRWAFKPYFTLGPKGLQLKGVPVPLADSVFCLRYRFLSKPYLFRLAIRAWGNLRSPPPKYRRDVTPAVLEALRQYVVDHGAVLCVGLTAREPELERYLESSKVPWVDLSTDLRVEGDWHWSPEGNTVVADKIERFLISGKFLSTNQH